MRLGADVHREELGEDLGLGQVVGVAEHAPLGGAAGARRVDDARGLVAVAAAVTVAFSAAVRRRIPAIAFLSGLLAVPLGAGAADWDVAGFVETVNHFRDSDGPDGLTKQRNTAQLEWNTSVTSKLSFSGVFRGSYDSVYDLNDDDFGSDAGGLPSAPVATRGMATTSLALRTGAVSGLATKFLAREDAGQVAAIFGAGVQARMQLWAVCEVRQISRAMVCQL